MSLSSTRRLNARFVVRFLVLELLVFCAQDAIQLFDELQEFLPVLLDRDTRAELVNAVVVGFVHREPGSITTPNAFCMFGVEHCPKLISLRRAPLGRDMPLGGQFSQQFDVFTEGRSELFENYIQFAQVRGHHGLSAQLADPIFQAA
jgi:hypothetical protein